MAHLRIIQGCEEKLVDLREDFLSIGRSPVNSLVVPAQRVSRFHCRLERHGDTHKIVDLGSRNGVKVNEDWVQQKVLRPGDTVHVGELIFVYEGSRSTSAPPRSAEVASRPSRGSAPERVRERPPQRSELASRPASRPAASEPRLPGRPRRSPRAGSEGPPPVEVVSSRSRVPRTSSSAGPVLLSFCGVVVAGLVFLVGKGMLGGGMPDGGIPDGRIPDGRIPDGGGGSVAHGPASSGMGTMAVADPIASESEISGSGISGSEVSELADSGIERGVSEQGVPVAIVDGKDPALPGLPLPSRPEGISPFESEGRSTDRTTARRPSDVARGDKRLVDKRLGDDGDFDEWRQQDAVEEARRSLAGTGGLSGSGGLSGNGGEDSAEPGRPGEPSIEDLYLGAGMAEDLGRTLRFSEAIAQIERVIRQCGVETGLRDEFSVMRSDLERQKELFSSVIEALSSGSGFVSRIRLPKLGSMRGADEEVLVCDRGRVAWGEVAGYDFIRLCEKLPLSARHRISAALYAQLARRDVEAHRLLAQAVEWEPAIRGEVDAVVSRWTGIEIPDGGFVYFRDRFVTADRRDSILRLERTDSLVSLLASREPEKVREGIAGLREIGGPSAQKGAEALLARHAALGEGLSGHAITGQLRRIKAEKEEALVRRAAALELIFDEELYPYPFRAPEAPPAARAIYFKTQQEIDERVARLRDLWDDPSPARTVVLSGPYARDLEVFQICEQGIVELDGAVEPMASSEFLSHLPPGERLINVQSLCLDRNELLDWMHNRTVLARNETVQAERSINPENQIEILSPEREQVRITNEYRILMGRRALILDHRLHASARGHSTEMGRLGYFGHVSPIPERSTVEKRVILAGFPTTDCGENCAQGMGAPATAHNGWCHSSGHHRNMLSTKWTHMGSGQSGGYWTQNYGFLVFDPAEEPEKPDRSETPR